MVGSARCVDVGDPCPEGDGSHASADASDGVGRRGRQRAAGRHSVEEDGRLGASKSGDLQAPADGG